jgi:putative hydrolase of the HAD superfamily
MFDYFNTLTDPIPSRRNRRSYVFMAARLGVEVDVIVAAFAACRSARLAGELGDSHATVRHIARMVGIENLTAEQVGSVVEARRQEMQMASKLRSDALPTVRELKRQGLKVGVISNCSVEFLDIWSEIGELADLVDGVLLSAEVGMSKPDSRIYELACTQIGVEPEKAIFVGDGEDDELAGAASAGMQPLWLIADDQRPTGPRAIDDVVTVSGLPEVVDLVVRSRI